VFTFNFSEVIKKNRKASFTELDDYMKKNIKKYQDIQITTSDKSLLKQPIVVEPADFK
jgi:arsenate reductase-like glutaredoxin family protein